MNDEPLEAPELIQQAELSWTADTTRRLLAAAEPRLSPHAVLVAGQPGAGKSVVCESTRQWYAEHGRCVSISRDDLLRLHPAWSAVVADPDPASAEQLLASTALLAALLIEEAIARQVHLLIEFSSDTNPTAAAQLVEVLADAGYYVELVILSVPPEESWQRIAEGSGATTVELLGRPVSWPQHQADYEQFVSLARTLAECQRLDGMHLITADGQAMLSHQGDDISAADLDLLSRAAEVDFVEGEFAEEDVAAEGLTPTPEPANAIEERIASDGRRIRLAAFSSERPPAPTASGESAPPSNQGSPPRTKTRGSAQPQQPAAGPRAVRLGDLHSASARKADPPKPRAMEPPAPSPMPLRPTNVTAARPRPQSAAEVRPAGHAELVPPAEEQAAGMVETLAVAHPATDASAAGTEIPWERYSPAEQATIRRRLEMQRIIREGQSRQ